MVVKQVSEHLAYRNDRLKKMDLTNPKLLGLAAIEINPTELCPDCKVIRTPRSRHCAICN